MHIRFVVLFFLVSIQHVSFGQTNRLQYKHYQPYMWMVGVGFSALDNDGRPHAHLLDFNNPIITPSIPNHLFVDRYYDYGFSFEGSASFNGFNSITLDNSLYPKRNLFTLDFALRYSFYDQIDGAEWFDPYVGIGLGLSLLDMDSRINHFYLIPTVNALAGINFWFGDFGTGVGDFGLRIQGSYKFGTLKNYRIADVSYRQYTLNLIYRFEIGEKRDDSFRKPKYKWVHDAPKEEKEKKQKKSE